MAEAIAQPDFEQLPLAEAVALAAEDPEFYGHSFFPKTCRQPSPPFHRKMWNLMLGSDHRYLAFMIFRGGAKTSIARLFMSLVTAYGIARTILVVGKSQDHAVKTVEWLMRSVEYNRIWSETFQLRKGSKWTGSEIDIWHGTDEIPIRIIALGITGSVRGINVDDYRPDLILVDDPCDEENTATPEQRKKIRDLFFGAIQKSLAPRSEAPMAKLILMQTVLNQGDLISECVNDAQFHSVVFSCFDSNGESAWKERWTTNELLEEKQAHVDRGLLSLWLREMECKLVSDETAAFPSHWLEYYEIEPEAGHTWIAVDPTPPPRDGALGKATRYLDDACIMALRMYKGTVYVLEVYTTKSPDPDEFINKLFEMCANWKCREVAIETILFARVLATLIEKEQARRRQWLTLHRVEDRRKKETRIRQEISPYASNHRIKVRKNQTVLIEQFISYPNVNHDDCLDALAIGLSKVNPWMESADYIEGEYDVIDDSDYPKQIQTWKAAP